LAKTLLLAGLLGGGYIAGCATAAQPHMYNALNALQTARAELVVAEHNKGGHRVIALQRVDEAINQVRLGIAAGGG
jgi:hypothetical protein